MSNVLRMSRRSLLTSGGKAALYLGAIGIAPRFIRPGRAFAADALAPGMIGGPTGFDGAERYQYSADTPEGRAVEAAKAFKAAGVDKIVLGLSDGSIGQLTQPFPAGAPTSRRSEACSCSSKNGGFRPNNLENIHTSRTRGIT